MSHLPPFLRALLAVLACLAVSGTASARELSQPDTGSRWELQELFGGQTYVPVTLEVQIGRLQAHLNTNPGDPVASLKLAKALEEAGRFTDALKLLKQRIGPETPGAAAATKEQLEATKDLASFQHRRHRIPEEVLLLRSMIPRVSQEEQAELFDRILSLIETYQLPQFDSLEILRQRVRLFPADHQVRLALLKRLVTTGEGADALKALDRAGADFPEEGRQWLRFRRRILERQGLQDQALKAYEDAVLPPPVIPQEILQDLLALLRNRRQLVTTRRKLESKRRASKLTAREAVLLVWILAEENRSHDAAKVLHGLPEPVRRGLGADRMGQLFQRLGMWPEAARSYFSAYLTAPDSSPAREGVLYRLAWVLDRSPSALPVLLDGPAAALVRPGRFDPDPGFVSGLLSLAFNSTDPAGRFSRINGMTRSWSGRGLSFRLAQEFTRQFPRSPRAEELFLRAMDRLLDGGSPSQVARFIQERIDVLGLDAEHAFGLRLRQAAALRQAGQRVQERQIYQDLLQQTPGDPEAAEQRRQHVFDLYAASLGESGDHARVLELYWTELERHPDRAERYERFLSYLSGFQLVEPELRVYERAIRNFKDSSWYHRLARWYLRNEKKQAFDKLLQDALKVFRGSDLEEFLREFVPSHSENSAQQALFLALHKDALASHPHRLFFVRRLANFYRSMDQDEDRLRLLARYFMRDPDLARQYVQELTRTGRLDEAVRTARSRAGGPGGSPYRRLLADSQSWECRFEEALPEYQKLLRLYPSDSWLARRVIDLLRSFRRLGEAASEVEAWLERLPDEPEMWVLLGELRIESGDPEGAVKAWNRVVELRPGDPDRYLQAATVFWDYFDFPRAAALLSKARTIVGDPDLHGVPLAAVHESAGDIEAAVAEYVRLLWRVDLYHPTARDRLFRLGKRPKIASTIRARFRKEIEDRPADSRVVLAFAEWLDMMSDQEGKTRLFLETAERSSDPLLLEQMASYFQATGTSSGSERVLKRLVEVSDAGRAHVLRLAAHHEGLGALEAARIVLLAAARKRSEDLAAGDPPGPAVIAWLDVAALAERGGDVSDRIEALEQAEAAAPAQQKGDLQIRRARALLDGGNRKSARALLRSVVKANPLDERAFQQLAEMAVESKDAKTLVEIYDSAMDAVRRSSLQQAARKQAILRFRSGLASSLLKLDRASEALDQWIEIINSTPHDPDLLRQAHGLASDTGQVERLLAFYRKTTEKSHKDWRWQSVLARLLVMEGRLEEAADRHLRASTLEPHRIDLREETLQILIQLKRYSQAAGLCRDLYRLDNRNSIWIETAARLTVRGGDLEAAIQELQKFLALGSRDAGSHLSAARLYALWGRGDEASRAASKVLALEGEASRTREVSSSRVSESLELLTRWSGASSALQAALNLWQQLQSGARDTGANHVVKARFENGRRALQSFLTSSFGETLRRYGSVRDLDQLPALSAARAEPELLPAMLGLAGQARLPDLQLALLELAWEGGVSLSPPAVEWIRRLHSVVLDREAERALIRSRMLAAAHGGERAALLLRLAQLASLSGDDDQSLVTLKELFDYAYRGSRYYRSTEVEWAYLKLLDHHRLTEELRALAESPTLGRINWFLRNDRQYLALRAVGAMSESTEWRRSKELLIRLHFGEGGQPVEEIFQGLTGSLVIGESTARSGAHTGTLVGRPWFWHARQWARYALDRGDPDAAAPFAAAGMEERSLDAARYAELGGWQLAAGNAEAATKLYSEALLLAPESWRYQLIAAAAHLQAGDNEEALQLLNTVVSRAGTDVDRVVLATEQMEQAGLGAPALDVLQTWLMSVQSRLPAPAILRLLPLQEALASGVATREARPLRQRVVEADTERIELLDLLSESPLVEGDERIGLLRMALQALSSGPYPDQRVVSDRTVRLGRALLEAGQHQGAASLARQVLAASAWHDDARLLLARCLVRLREMEALQGLLDSILQGRWIAPRMADRMARLLREEGVPEQAARLLERHHAARLAANPVETGSALALARAQFERGAAGAAMEVLKRTALASPEDKNFLSLAADLLEEAQQYDEAIQYREMIRERRPSDRLNGLAMARLFRKLARFPESLEILNTLLFGRDTPSDVRSLAIMEYATAVAPDPERLKNARIQCDLERRSGQRPEVALRAEAAAMASAGQTVQAAELLAREAPGLPAAAGVWRDLALLRQNQGKLPEAAAAFKNWWRYSRDDQAALGMFRALARLGRHDQALTARTPPGCQPYGPFQLVEKSWQGSPSPDDLAKVRGPVYTDPVEYALDAAACLETLEAPEPAIALLGAAKELAVRDSLDGARLLNERIGRLKDLVSRREQDGRQTLEIGEGIENE